MIKTERQYATTKTQLERLVRALELSRVTAGEAPPPAYVDPLFVEAHQRALESQIADLRAELAEYDMLRSGARSVIPVMTLADLPLALIQARIARGWTQADLAGRLDMAEQQVQRYEATGYDAASFSRLKEVARALDVDVPSTVVPNDLAVSPRQFVARLQEIGFDREVVLGKVLPPDVAAVLRAPLMAGVAAGRPEEMTESIRRATTRAGAIVSRVLSVDLADFFASAPLRLAPANAIGLRFKQTAAQAERATQRRLRDAAETSGAGSGAARDRQRAVGRPRDERSTADTPTVDAYTLYAQYLALLLLETADALAVRSIPNDPQELIRILRAEYREYGGVTLEAVTRLAWDYGIPVLPLSDGGHFHGACWRVGGRSVIVLKQRATSLALWLFDLLHELRHTAQHPEREEFAAVDGEPGSSSVTQTPATSDAIADDEEDAMAFAGDVVLDGRAEALAQEAVRAAAGRMERLKLVVPTVAARGGVASASLANYLAFRLAKQGENWWGAARNLQPAGEDPFGTVRDVLLERADLSRLNPVDRQLLLGALRAEPTVHA